MSRIEGLLAAAAARYPDSIAIRDTQREVSWAALHRESEDIARQMASAGIVAGDRVVVLGRNRIVYAAALFGSARIGAVLVPLNTRLLPSEQRALVARSGAKLVLADAVLADALGELPERCAGVLLDPAMVSGWEPLDRLGETALPSHSEQDSAVALQMYTSGTTGLPKGAMLTHRNLVAMTESWLHEMTVRSPEDTFLQVTPLYHIGAVLMLLSCAATGTKMLLHAEFSPISVARTLACEGVTHTLLVPAMIRWLLDDPGCRDMAFPSLRMLVYGAAPMPSAELRRAMVRFGCDLLQGYGLTESAGVLTVLRPEDHRREGANLQSAGRPVNGVEIDLVSAGRSVAAGEVGEVIARGPNVFVGYHDMPEDSASALRDGWLYTGDLGIMDSQGFLTITDRSKDMILVGGENVYPREIEDLLRSHPLVSDVAVIGIPHDTWGESVLAVVVPAREIPEGERADAVRTLIHFARSQIARFKCPTDVSFCAALPRNAAGKVQKVTLRAPYWAGRERLV